MKILILSAFTLGYLTSKYYNSHQNTYIDNTVLKNSSVKNNFDAFEKETTQSSSDIVNKPLPSKVVRKDNRVSRGPASIEEPPVQTDNKNIDVSSFLTISNFDLEFEEFNKKIHNFNSNLSETINQIEHFLENKKNKTSFELVNLSNVINLLEIDPYERVDMLHRVLLSNVNTDNSDGNDYLDITLDLVGQNASEKKLYEVVENVLEYKNSKDKKELISYYALYNLDDANRLARRYNLPELTFQ